MAEVGNPGIGMANQMFGLLLQHQRSQQDAEQAEADRAAATERAQTRIDAEVKQRKLDRDLTRKRLDHDKSVSKKDFEARMKRFGLAKDRLEHDIKTGASQQGLWDAQAAFTEQRRQGLIKEIEIQDANARAEMKLSVLKDFASLRNFILDGRKEDAILRAGILSKNESDEYRDMLMGLVNGPVSEEPADFLRRAQLEILKNEPDAVVFGFQALLRGEMIRPTSVGGGGGGRDALGEIVGKAIGEEATDKENIIIALGNKYGGGNNTARGVLDRMLADVGRGILRDRDEARRTRFADSHIDEFNINDQGKAREHLEDTAGLRNTDLIIQSLENHFPGIQHGDPIYKSAVRVMTREGLLAPIAPDQLERDTSPQDVIREESVGLGPPRPQGGFQSTLHQALGQEDFLSPDPGFEAGGVGGVGAPLQGTPGEFQGILPPIMRGIGGFGRGLGRFLAPTTDPNDFNLGT